MSYMLILLVSFSIALVGYTYSIILTDTDMILNNWYMFLQKKLEDKHPKLFNVLVNCPKCVSGQWSLWLFFLLPYYCELKIVYAIMLHIVFITLTIWFSLIINKFHKWLN